MTMRGPFPQNGRPSDQETGPSRPASRGDEPRKLTTGQDVREAGSLQISTSSDNLGCHPLTNLLNHRQLFLELREMGKGLEAGAGLSLCVHTEMALGPADAFQATFPGTEGPSAPPAP